VTTGILVDLRYNICLEFAGIRKLISKWVELKSLSNACSFSEFATTSMHIICGNNRDTIDVLDI